MLFVVRQFSARCRTPISCIATVRLFFATPLSISVCLSTNLEIHSYSPNTSHEIIFYPEHGWIINANTKSHWRGKRKLRAQRQVPLRGGRREVPRRVTDPFPRTCVCAQVFTPVLRGISSEADMQQAKEAGTALLAE